VKSQDSHGAERQFEAAAQIIGVTKIMRRAVIRRGDVKGRQICKGAPWVIKADDVAAFSARMGRLASRIATRPVHLRLLPNRYALIKQRCGVSGHEH
jgi:hypothetical protein